MKKTNILTFIMALALYAASGPAMAVTVISLVGDKDGFGLPGAPAVPADGTLWVDTLGGTFFTDYRTAGDIATAPFTDIWGSAGGFSYSHTYSLSGLTPLSAVLDLQIAGVHDIDLDMVDNVVVDATNVGVIPPNLSATAPQEVKLYSFNIPLALINGSDSVSVGITGGDGYIVNFSELRIQAVPEPTTALTIGLGLVGLLAWGRRRHGIRFAR